MAVWRLKRRVPKLALRIYLFGLAQFTVVMVGMFVVLTRSQHPPLPFADTLHFVVETIAATGGDRAQVSAVVARLRGGLRCSVAVYDGQGRLAAHDPDARPPGLRADAKPPRPELAAPIPMPDGTTWSLVFLVAPPISKPPVFPAWIAVIVSGVGLFSVFIARSVVRPLARLAVAAHDFGAGKMDARVRMNRSDELGQVAAAFDRMADQVTQALRAEKELLANVSHELRTPLQRIHIAIELAGEGDASTAHGLLGELGDDLAELERIVEDVLTAARLSLRDGTASANANANANASASPRLRAEPLEVRGLIDKAATRFRTRHSRRPLHIEVGDDLPAVSADPVLLRRVFDNLLDNADKYTDDPAAEISLVARRASEGVVIEVRDQGRGIGPEDLQRVFEPFFRADRSRTRTTGGLGLGLALARRIVEAHGGTLTVKSTLGSGTTARVSLPSRLADGHQADGVYG